MDWINPLPLQLVTSADGESFCAMEEGRTALPLPPHPGAFGVTRKHHVHEGVDLYCAEGTPVTAVEEGVVVARLAFTGPKAGSPWWHDTEALLVEGASGVVVYGEIMPHDFRAGTKIAAGQKLGYVVQVLKTDKGRPQSMLHLELHHLGTRDVYEWRVGEAKPPSLLDPTPWLLKVAA